MIDNLMCESSVVLQEIVVLSSTRTCQLLDHRQDFAQLVVRYVCQFCSMMLWDDKLKNGQSFTQGQLERKTLAVRVEFRPCIDRGVWTYCMASAERLYIEKCENLVRLKELEGGNVACPEWSTFGLSSSIRYVLDCYNRHTG
jgi:hypothetical protein